MLLSLNICCDPSLEPSHRDGSNEGPQHMFLLRNKKNCLCIIFNTPSYRELCLLVPGTPGTVLHQYGGYHFFTH